MGDLFGNKNTPLKSTTKRNSKPLKKVHIPKKYVSKTDEQKNFNKLVNKKEQNKLNKIINEEIK